MASFDEPIQRGTLNLGSYLPNHFILRLAASAPFATDTDSGTLVMNDEHMSVYWHEYIHYWQNISTVSGFKSFAETQYILAAASEVIVAAGGTFDTILGPLDAATADHLAGLARIMEANDGDSAPSGYREPDESIDLNILGYSLRELTVPLRNGSPRVHEAILHCEVRENGKPLQRLEMRLGSLVIEESAAVLAQGVVDQSTRTTHSWHVPTFPYRVMEAIVRRILGQECSPCQMYCAATVALMSLHPGPALLQYLERVKELMAGSSLDAALSAAASEALSGEAAVLKVILDTDLPDLEGIHAGRGFVEDAVKEYGRMFRAAILRRTVDPFFDARRFFDQDNIETAVREQLREFPACDLIQEREDHGQEPRDLLLASEFTSGEPVFRVLQAQQHLARTVIRHVSKNAAKAACYPFYHSCTFDLRRTEPSVCAQAPWRTAEHTATCWYGLAASALRGTLKVIEQETSDGSTPPTVEM